MGNKLDTWVPTGTTNMTVTPYWLLDPQGLNKTDKMHQEKFVTGTYSRYLATGYRTQDKHIAAAHGHLRASIHDAYRADKTCCDQPRLCVMPQ